MSEEVDMALAVESLCMTRAFYQDRLAKLKECSLTYFAVFIWLQ